MHRSGLRVEGPAGGDVDLGDRERHGHRPRAGLVSVGVPCEGLRVDTPGGESIRHEVAEHRGADVTPDPRPARLRDDELALGDHRSLVPTDVLDRDPALLGHVLRRSSGTDPHLDLAGAENAGLLGPQLLELGTIAADRSTQRLVDAQTELLAVLRHQHEVLPVVVQSDQLELTHADLLSLGSEPATVGA
ncbi:hypothetical protein GALL_363050 [mine drainage metagenome]|uniref:Uncharacterized protein n=1 Tax=mine drainage metagenome TaxID=410659 RepID=A0A1J5QWT4_9ZZZZ